MDAPLHLSKRQFRDHVPKILDLFEKSLENRGKADGCGEAHKKAATKERELECHGLSRWEQGFEIAEVVIDWNHLRNSVGSALHQALEAHPEWGFDAFRAAWGIMLKLMDEGVNRSVARFDTLRQSEARGRYLELQESVAALEAIVEQQSVRYREIVHDLKGNLGVLCGVAKSLEKGSATSEIKALYGPLDEGLKASLQILEELKYHTMLESGVERPQCERFDVSAFIHRIVQPFSLIAREEDLELSVDGPDNFEVDCDSHKLARILQNLLSNAFKFTTSGTVALKWGATESSELWGIQLENRGVLTNPRRVTLLAGSMTAASNTGERASIVPDCQHRFRDVADEAAPESDPVRIGLEGRSQGIGLSIAKRLTDLMGGRLSVVIEEDNSAVRAELVLPVHEQPKACEPGSD